MDAVGAGINLANTINGLGNNANNYNINDYASAFNNISSSDEACCGGSGAIFAATN